MPAARSCRGRTPGRSSDERTPGVLGVVLGDRVQVESDDSDDDERRQNCVEDDDEGHGVSFLDGARVRVDREPKRGVASPSESPKSGRL